MSAKEYKFDQEAQKKILNGVNIVAKCVGSTIGPRGRVVMIRKRDGSVAITKDGISVAKSIELKDHFEDMAARLIRGSSQKSVEQTGDGTSATVVLAAQMINEGSKLISAGHSPRDITNGISFAVDKVVETLKANSKPSQDLNDIENVAIVSANGDKQIGSMLRQAFEKVGNSGLVSIEAGKGITTDLEVVNGYRFDRGFLSSHFITNEKSECVLQDVRILITDEEINNVNVILPILEKTNQQYPNKPLLIIGNCVGDCLATLCVNHLKGALKSCAVKNPGYGQRRVEMMEDLAILTGATFISSTAGMRLEQFDASWLGGADKVVVTSGSTTIINGLGSSESVEARVAIVRNQIVGCEEHEKEQQAERLAKLIGGVAVIYVGGYTEQEVLEKVDRWSDALGATRAAAEEGISVGGGKALVNCIKVLDNVVATPDLKYGIEIVKRAIQEPLRRIARNAGREEVEVLITSINNDNPNFGYNAQSEKFEDLMESGVIDPTKVIRCALQNAVSCSNLILTTDCMIADQEDEKDAKK
jgi:chaperonin GroEL